MLVLIGFAGSGGPENLHDPTTTLPQAAPATGKADRFTHRANDHADRGGRSAAALGRVPLPKGRPAAPGSDARKTRFNPIDRDGSRLGEHINQHKEVSSDADKHVLRLFDSGFVLVRRGRSFQTLDQGTQLKGEETIVRSVTAEQRQEGFCPNQHSLRLAVNGQDITGTGVFQRIQYLRKIAVKLTTANEANAGL
jgi:hypothetical protein